MIHIVLVQFKVLGFGFVVVPLAVTKQESKITLKSLWGEWKINSMHFRFSRSSSCWGWLRLPARSMCRSNSRLGSAWKSSALLTTCFDPPNFWPTGAVHKHACLMVKNWSKSVPPFSVLTTNMFWSSQLLTNTCCAQTCMCYAKRLIKKCASCSD